MLPFAATAATVTGDFQAGGTPNLLVVNADPSNPVVGSTVIDTDLTDIAGGSFDFVFTTAEDAIVSGLGNVRRASSFTNLAATFAGVSVTLVSDGFDQLNFRLPEYLAMATETFTLNFTYGSAKDSNAIDFDIELAAAPSAVPVPAAGGLLLLALGGIAALRRRKSV